MRTPRVMGLIREGSTVPVYFLGFIFSLVMALFRSVFAF